MKVPSPGESISEVEIAEWLVKDGDFVEKDQTIAEVDSDKATLDLPAEESGVITLKAEEGDAVEVGAVVCLIDTAAAKPEGSSTISDKATVKETPKVNPIKEEVATTYASGNASPAAKKILAEKGMDTTTIKGTGKAGRITKDDAVKAVPSMGTMPADGNRVTTRKKMSMLRRKVAERLVEAKNTTAMLTTFNEVDMTELKRMRAEYRDAFETRHGIRLGYMSFFVRACAEALKKYPAVNASVDGSDIVYHGYQDIGVAVSSDRGLVVPILRDTDSLSLAETELKISEFGGKAKAGKLSIEDMTGGTFTISNGGVFGSLLSTPILNPPQTAILGMHTIQDRPVARDGEVVIRPMMYLALSYDHRLIDGKEAVQFLIAVKEVIEDPTRILLNLQKIPRGENYE